MGTALSIRNALRFAVKAHGDQRYGPDPYVTHLLAVLSVAFEFGIVDEDILVAIPLHDAIEDTDVTKEEVAAEFGPWVADLADAVSDPPGFKKRKERKKAAYPRMLAVPGSVKVKLCDRIANVRSCWREAQAEKRASSLLGMYKKEHGGFRKALRAPDDELDEIEKLMWDELDRLIAWNP